MRTADTTFEVDSVTAQLTDRFSGQGHREELSARQRGGPNNRNGRQGRGSFEEIEARYGEERALYQQGKSAPRGNYVATTSLQVREFRFRTLYPLHCHAPQYSIPIVPAGHDGQHITLSHHNDHQNTIREHRPIGSCSQASRLPLDTMCVDRALTSSRLTVASTRRVGARVVLRASCQPQMAVVHRQTVAELLRLDTQTARLHRAHKELPASSTGFV